MTLMRFRIWLSGNYLNMNYFKDKVIIITGASSGIGLASAKYFSSLEAKVVLAARSMDKLKTVSSDLDADRILCVETDVRKEEDCRNLIEQTVARFGKIDVLVNNAGISMRAMFGELDLCVIKSLMDTNFWGTVYCTKFALPYLLKTKGSVVGVISTAGFVGLPARTGYSASKFAIRGFLNTLRVEHLYDGLHVMVFAPGFTSSNIRNVALTADGSLQGNTPRDEGKMMSAEKVAKLLAKGIRRRKRQMILTPLGKITVCLSLFCPHFADVGEYKFMADEPDTPIKKQ